VVNRCWSPRSTSFAAANRTTAERRRTHGRSPAPPRRQHRAVPLLGSAAPAKGLARSGRGPRAGPRSRRGHRRALPAVARRSRDGDTRDAGRFADGRAARRACRSERPRPQQRLTLPQPASNRARHARTRISSKADLAEMRTCMALWTDCADVCGLVVQILSRPARSDHVVAHRLLQACIRHRALCAEECARHAEHHPHCTICAKGCRACEAACRAPLEAEALGELEKLAGAQPRPVATRPAASSRSPCRCGAGSPASAARLRNASRSEPPSPTTFRLGTVTASYFEAPPEWTRQQPWLIRLRPSRAIRRLVIA